MKTYRALAWITTLLSMTLVLGACNKDGPAEKPDDFVAGAPDAPPPAEEPKPEREPLPETNSPTFAEEVAEDSGAWDLGIAGDYQLFKDGTEGAMAVRAGTGKLSISFSTDPRTPDGTFLSLALKKPMNLGEPSTSSCSGVLYASRLGMIDKKGKNIRCVVQRDQPCSVQLTKLEAKNVEGNYTATMTCMDVRKSHKIQIKGKFSEVQIRGVLDDPPKPVKIEPSPSPRAPRLPDMSEFMKNKVR